MAIYNLGGENPPSQSEVEAAIAAAIDALIDGAPGALNTLNELALSLGNDENFATTVTNALALRAKLNQANTFTVGGHTVTSQGGTVIPLTLKGAAGQTASLLLVQDASNTSRFSVSDTGYVTTANVQSDGGLRVGTGVTYTTNQRWLSVQDAQTLPATVTNGVIFFSEAGVPKVRTATGVVTIGTSGGNEVRSDFVAPFSYLGVAPAGTSEAAAAWTITRIDTTGPVVVTTATGAAWADRTTVNYS
jgi:hypothetical protein